MARGQPDLLLTPGDPLRPREVDEHFAAEAAAAADIGVEVARLDHDALVIGDVAGSVRTVPTGRTARYRGWMVTSKQYASLESVLSMHGIRLRTPAGRYRAAHEFPGWYRDFEHWTPRSVWTERPDVRAGLETVASLPRGPVVVRDFTKSMKHYWTEAAFIPDSADEAAVERVLARFVELRGADIQGGFVFRAFEPFVGPEVRTWWLEEQCFLISPHPDRPDQLVDESVPISQLATTVARLACPFATVDLARRADGVWQVVEVGDGQVSDRPLTVPASALITPLFTRTRSRE